MTGFEQMIVDALEDKAIELERAAETWPGPDFIRRADEFRKLAGMIKSSEYILIRPECRDEEPY